MTLGVRRDLEPGTAARGCWFAIALALALTACGRDGDAPDEGPWWMLVDTAEPSGIQALTLDRHGAARFVPLASTGATLGRVAWSRDGSMVAFSADLSLAIARPQRSSTVLWSSSDASRVGGLDWLDDQRLVFATTDVANTQTLVVDVATGELRSLGRAPVGRAEAVPSFVLVPGRGVMFPVAAAAPERCDWHYLAASPRDASPLPIVQASCTATFVASADGRYLAMTGAEQDPAAVHATGAPMRAWLYDVTDVPRLLPTQLPSAPRTSLRWLGGDGAFLLRMDDSVRGGDVVMSSSASKVGDARSGVWPVDVEPGSVAVGGRWLFSSSGERDLGVTDLITREARIIAGLGRPVRYARGDLLFVDETIFGQGPLARILVLDPATDWTPWPLTPDLSVPRGSVPVEVSPRGDLIAYADEPFWTAPPTLQLVKRATPHDRTNVALSGTRSTTRLSLLWTPDGRRLLVRTTEQGRYCGDLHSVDPGTGRAVRVAHSAAGAICGVSMPPAR